MLKSIRNHGPGTDRYENARLGLNSRLDTIQAAILIEKLKIFPDEIELRETVAQRYNEGLGNLTASACPRDLGRAIDLGAIYDPGP